MFSRASGDRSSCEMSCSSRRSAVSSVSRRSAMSLNAWPRSPISSLRDDPYAHAQIPAPELVDGAGHVPQRPHDTNRQEPGETHDSRENEHVVRHEGPDAERWRREDDQPIPAVPRRIDHDEPVIDPRRSEPGPRHAQQRRPVFAGDHIATRGIGEVVGRAQRLIEPRDECRCRIRALLLQCGDPVLDLTRLKLTNETHIRRSRHREKRRHERHQRDQQRAEHGDHDPRRQGAHESRHRSRRCSPALERFGLRSSPHLRASGAGD